MLLFPFDLLYFLLCFLLSFFFSFFFFFNDTAPTEIYTLSLHDALPISVRGVVDLQAGNCREQRTVGACGGQRVDDRSEEHTSELQSHLNLVCRLLLEKKKKNNKYTL